MREPEKGLGGLQAWAVPVWQLLLMSRQWSSVEVWRGH